MNGYGERESAGDRAGCRERERKIDGDYKETRRTERRDAENMNLNMYNCYFRLQIN